MTRDEYETLILFKKRVWRLAAVASGVLVLGLGSVLGYAYFISRPDKGWPIESFDPQHWRTATKEARYVYCKDLKRRGLLVHLTLGDVVSLLGAPDYQAPDGRYVTYIVKLRGKSDFGMNAIYLLHVQFGEHGRVNDAFVRAE